jgi:hypothetical protein
MPQYSVAFPECGRTRREYSTDRREAERMFLHEIAYGRAVILFSNEEPIAMSFECRAYAEMFQALPATFRMAIELKPARTPAASLPGR